MWCNLLRKLHYGGTYQTRRDELRRTRTGSNEPARRV